MLVIAASCIRFVFVLQIEHSQYLEVFAAAYRRTRLWIMWFATPITSHCAGATTFWGPLCDRCALTLRDVT
jgi:hypothetical protein